MLFARCWERNNQGGSARLPSCVASKFDISCIRCFRCGECAYLSASWAVPVPGEFLAVFTFTWHLLEPQRAINAVVNGVRAACASLTRFKQPAGSGRQCCIIFTVSCSWEGDEKKE